MTINDNGISISSSVIADLGENVVTFTQASTRANIESGEKLNILFGKIKKWFADLKAIAFTGSYSDLINVPALTIPDNSITTSKIVDSAITSGKLASGLIFPGTPQIGTPSGLNGASQNVATIGNVNDALTNIQIGGTNIYQDINGVTDFYLSTTITQIYRRFLDLTAEAKRNLRGQSLSVSYDYILDNVTMGGVSSGFQFNIRYADGTQTLVNAMLPAVNDTPISKYGRFNYTVKIEDKEIISINSYQPYLYLQTRTGTVTIGRPKFEIGTKATQWSPSPEEAQASLNAAIQTVQDLADQLETDVNNTLGDYMIDIVQPAIDSSISEAISDIAFPTPATTNAPGTVRLATQEEVDTGEVTENIPEGSDPNEPPAVAVTPMDLQGKLSGYATTTALGSKADVTALPQIFYQSTAPTTFKTGDIWIKP